MKIGYARTSRTIQNLDLQLDALNAVGCDRVFTDQMSGGRSDRPGLLEALAFCRPDDTLVVWRLDRLGRSLQHLVATVSEMEARGVQLHSLTESIDTSSPTGKLVFHLFAALAEFERQLIRERTRAGLEAARARGRKGGRRKKLDATQIEIAKKLRADPSLSIDDACRTLGVSRATFYRLTTG